MLRYTQAGVGLGRCDRALGSNVLGLQSPKRACAKRSFKGGPAPLLLGPPHPPP